MLAADAIPAPSVGNERNGITDYQDIDRALVDTFATADALCLIDMKLILVELVHRGACLPGFRNRWSL